MTDKRNAILAALTPEQHDALKPHLERVWLPLGRVLCDPRNAARFVYFPEGCVVSLASSLQDGSGTEIALIGREGAVGLAFGTPDEGPPMRAVVHAAGHARRVAANVMLSFVQRDSGMRQLMLRNTLALLRHAAQAALCNRHHTVEQQVCRRLLAIRDRIDSDEIFITHQCIADVLGVRREGVTDAARRLAKLGLVSYRRGRVTVLDRARLAARACECYAAAGGADSRAVSTGLADDGANVAPGRVVAERPLTMPPASRDEPKFARR